MTTETKDTCAMSGCDKVPAYFQSWLVGVKRKSGIVCRSHDAFHGRNNFRLAYDLTPEKTLEMDRKFRGYKGKQ